MKSIHALLAALLAAFLLAGCASTAPTAISAQVRSSAATATAEQSALLRAGVRYRFEHLPLQTDSEMSGPIHALAQDALAAVGLVRDDTNALISVQVQASSAVDWVYDDYWGWGWPYRSRLYWGMGFGWRHGGMMLGGPLDMPTPIYLSEVGFVMRSLNGGQVLYETHARHDSTRSAGSHTIAALFAAALQGFPTPPAGWRRVSVPLPQPEQGTHMAPVPLPAASAPVSTR